MEQTLDNDDLIDKKEELDESISSFNEQSFNSYYSDKNDDYQDIDSYVRKRHLSYASKKTKEEKERYENQKIIEEINSLKTIKEEDFVLFSSKDVIKSEFLLKEKFAISKNYIVTTYLMDFFTFSQFTHPKEIEKDARVSIFVLDKDDKANVFQYNAEDITNHLSIHKVNVQKVDSFLKGINKFLAEEEYVQIKNDSVHYCYFIYISIIFSILFAVGIISFSVLRMLKTKNLKMLYFLFSLTLVIFALIILVCRCRRMKVRSASKIMQYMIKHEKERADYVESWNKSFFDIYKIRVMVPLTVDYILFNLNANQEIKIADIDMSKYREMFHPEKGSEGDESSLGGRSNGINGINISGSDIEMN